MYVTNPLYIPDILVSVSEFFEEDDNIRLCSTSKELASTIKSSDCCPLFYKLTKESIVKKDLVQLQDPRWHTIFKPKVKEYFKCECTEIVNCCIDKSDVTLLFYLFPLDCECCDILKWMDSKNRCKCYCPCISDVKVKRCFLCLLEYIKRLTEQLSSINERARTTPRTFNADFDGEQLNSHQIVSVDVLSIYPSIMGFYYTLIPPRMTIAQLMARSLGQDVEVRGLANLYTQHSIPHYENQPRQPQETGYRHDITARTVVTGSSNNEIDSTSLTSSMRRFVDSINESKNNKDNKKDNKNNKDNNCKKDKIKIDYRRVVSIKSTKKYFGKFKKSHR